MTSLSLMRSGRVVAPLLAFLAIVVASTIAGARQPPTASSARQTAMGEGWTPLFNGRNLEGWYTWLPSTGRNTDPKRVFDVHDEMLHILNIPVTGQDEEFGYVATENEYGNYRLRFQYRWGARRFAPRANDKRDSGLLYHVVGPDTVWPRSVECQVQEGDTGDFFMIDDTALSSTVESLDVLEKTYREGGTPHAQTGGRIVKSGTYDRLSDWNTVEVIVTGDEAVHIVNGQINNRGSAMRQPDPGDPGRAIPLTRGRILFQAEGAEVFYRDIMIKSIEPSSPPPDAITLLDPSAWQAADGGALRWPLVDGILEVCPGCGDIQTVRTFQDFRLHVEVRVPSTAPEAAEQDRGNSGIYLQDRYEIQVLDSFGRPLGDANDAAAIYGVKDPDANAATPAETWQSYDIVFQAARWSGDRKTENARVSVTWNDVLVHDGVQLPGTTAGGAAEGPGPGPIRLQDHGQSVRYRNIWIEPLP